MCNTSTVNIGGKELSIGDVFDGDDEIVWKDKCQAIKVIGESNHQIFVLVAEEMQEKRLKSLADYVIREVRLSSRGDGELKTVYLLDNLALPSIVYNKSGDYIIEYRLLGKQNEVRLSYTGEGDLIIARSIFATLKQASVYANIFFVASGTEERIPIVENLKIVILPLETVI